MIDWISSVQFRQTALEPPHGPEKVAVLTERAPAQQVVGAHSKAVTSHWLQVGDQVAGVWHHVTRAHPATVVLLRHLHLVLVHRVPIVTSRRPLDCQQRICAALQVRLPWRIRHKRCEGHRACEMRRWGLLCMARNGNTTTWSYDVFARLAQCRSTRTSPQHCELARGMCVESAAAGPSM